MKSKQHWASLKRVFSLLLIGVLISSAAPWGQMLPAFAAIDAGDSIIIDSIDFVKEHDGLEMSSAYVQIIGSGLKDAAVLFEKTATDDPLPLGNGGFQPIGTRVDFGMDAVNNIIIKYTFTDKQALSLTGKILIGNKTLDLKLSSFPNINKLNLKNVNVSVPDNLVMNGNNLDKIDGGDVKATYGRDIKKNFLRSGGDTANQITLVAPTPESSFGFQDIEFSRTGKLPPDPADPATQAATTIKYTYSKAFRFTQNLGYTNLEMFPNIGATGDYIYLQADAFPPATYQVHLMKTLDGTEEYSSVNMAKTINLDTLKKQLVVQVPPGLSEGDYNVVLTKVENGEVVAEQIVGGIADPSVYTIVDSLKKLNIEQISPTSGPDTGVDVTVVAKNMINMNIPGLVLDADTKTYAGEDGDQTLVVSYGGGTFNGKTVTVKRRISIFVGNKAFFQRNGAGDFDIDAGTNDSPDKVSIRTASIDDVLNDPTKDVLVETETILTVAGPGGKVYAFKQSDTLANAFKFIPSTLTPTIDKVIPDMVQVVDDAGGDFKLKQDTLLVIRGTKFNVYKKTNADGTVEMKKPTVLIKGVGNISEAQYQVGFFPNDPAGGRIKTKVTDADPAVVVVKDTAGQDIPLELTVLNDNNEVVDGTVGNETGTRIVIKIPKEVTFKVANVKKNIQVSNPRLGSDDFGNAVVKYDAVEILTTSDYPIIEAVAPNVVSIDGNVEIIVRGTNFANGVKVYLDGNEIPGVQREVDTSGDKINLKFKAPAGREGMTQLQVMNPSGGMAVWDFIYVKSFNKDPILKSISPAKGIYGTLVSANGDNFLKPDPTAPTNIGLDAFRLIGSKIYLDGKDVNVYNSDVNGNLRFLDYSAPVDGDFLTKDSNNLAQFSNLAKNAFVNGYPRNDPNYDYGSPNLLRMEYDELRRPVVTDGDDIYYVFRYNPAAGGTYQAYNKQGTMVDGDITIDQLLTDEFGRTTLYIDDSTVVGGEYAVQAWMDNEIIRWEFSPDGKLIPKLADYARSIILREDTPDGSYSFFTLSEDFEGNIKLSNGKDKVYKIIVAQGGVAIDERFKAVTEAGVISNIKFIHDSPDGKLGNNAIEVGAMRLNFTTAYKFDETSRIITGNRTKVISKDQILFTVPVLSTGTGFKDVAVVNPDTKRAELKGPNGFYYVSQAGSYPLITSIDPPEGSDAGGYTVTIHGADFQDGVKVIVDSQTVPDADVFLALDGKSISFTMPATLKDLKNDYGVDRFTVPVVVLNTDGASASVERGFTYIKPSSIPLITKVIADTGSSNGNEIVEIFGSDFRFFEPFKDADNDGSSYEGGDVFTDLNGNGKWDNYLTYLTDGNTAEMDKIKVPDTTNPYHTFHYDSEVFPRIFFGNKEAKIVNFGNGYIKVITPANPAGKVNLYLVNNDSGITNKMAYTYISSKPKLTSIIPSIGRKTGQELKEIYGTDLYGSSVKGYYNLTDIGTAPVSLSNVQALVRFGDIDNREIQRNLPNSGLINNGNATINLEGGLKVTYNADPTPTLTVQVLEKGNVYTQTFAYDNTDVFIPMGMLKTSVNYYSPGNYQDNNPNDYDPAKDIFEYLRVNIEDRRVFVERGYSPNTIYDNTEHVTAMTPSYYTIDTVPVTYTNPDGGTAKIDFTYTNPASDPKIYDMKPKVDTDDKLGFLVEGSVKGGWEFEIRGTDFREGAEVLINGVKATVVEITKVSVPDPANPTTPMVLDNIIVKVPVGAVTDIDKRYPVFVQNTDKGIANSTTLDNRIGPDAGKPIYFVYRKPLSDPVVKSVSPKETSAAGGNTITITGTDFRDGASVIVGSKNGIPMPNVVVSNQGTKITFTTATNLTLGTKAITVQNSDYGSFTLNNALTIISAPTVVGPILSSDGTTVKNRVSLEGGEEIIIKGTNFLTGAQVYFGGKPILDTSETRTGTYGLYKDDKYYILKDGTPAAKVTFVDENTLKVVTPEKIIEGKIYVTVINPDKGISNGDTELTYSVPVPSDPVNLKAELIAEQYIRLYGYTSSNANYYEIFYYIGSKTETQLTSNKYEDFTYLNNTETEPYKITKLPGLDKLVEGQKVYFVIKAANKFGFSSYSNIAYIPYDVLKFVKELGQPDIDGEIGVPGNKTHLVEQKGDTSLIQISSKYPDRDLVITVSKDQAAKAIKRLVNVPEDIVFNGTGVYTVHYGDLTLQFMAQHLNTAVFKDLTMGMTTYGQMNAQIQNNAYGNSLKLAIPRTQRAVSKIFTLAPYATNNQDSQRAEAFSGNIDAGLSFAEMGLTEAQEKNVRMYLYNSEKNKWDLMPSRVDTTQNMVFSRINRAGDYILLIQK